MTELVDIGPKWKSQLSSDCSRSQIKALSEIILTINHAENSKKQNILRILINHDYCHFLCELLSYDSLKKTPFINKIVTELSENEKFYNNEIFKVLKGYFRLLNSFPKFNSQLCDNRFIDDIFKSIYLLILR